MRAVLALLALALLLPGAAAQEGANATTPEETSARTDSSQWQWTDWLLPGLILVFFAVIGSAFLFWSRRGRGPSR